jgi:hypothetical protein
MGNVLIRSAKDRTQSLRTRLTACQQAGYLHNLGTRFQAYVDDGADWVFACDADVVCLGDLRPVTAWAEGKGLDVVTRTSMRYSQIQASSGIPRGYRDIFRKHGLTELDMQVPNIYLVRGHLSRRLSVLAEGWIKHLHRHGESVRLGRSRTPDRKGFGNSFWNDQLGFTMALSELGPPEKRMGRFTDRQVSEWWQIEADRPAPALVHVGHRRWRKCWRQGSLQKRLGAGQGNQ